MSCADVLDLTDSYISADLMGNQCKNPFYLATVKNRGVLGILKDDMGEKLIDEFIALRAKMYNLSVGGKDKSRAKGIPKEYVEKELKHEDFNNALFNATTEPDYMDELLGREGHRNNASINFSAIRSEGHKLSTVNITKLGLNAYDDKRYILEDGIHTLAHGHYRIAEINRGGNPQAATD